MGSTTLEFPDLDRITVSGPYFRCRTARTTDRCSRPAVAMALPHSRAGGGGGGATNMGDRAKGLWKEASDGHGDNRRILSGGLSLLVDMCMGMCIDMRTDVLYVHKDEHCVCMNARLDCE